MYRPTVRYSDIYRDHINKLFKSTTLDRNQIIRLALHVAAHSNQFQKTLSKYKTGDVPLPYPQWKVDSHGLWFENNQVKAKGGKDVNVNISRDRQTESFIGTDAGSSSPQETSDRCEQQIKRREREIPTKRIPLKSEGGTLSWSPFG